jgi:thiamine kinase-like enzyme
VPASLDQVIRRLEPLLGEPDGEPVALSGGITNRNFRVRLGGSEYVVRISGKDTMLLGIDRSAEQEATITAAEAGIAPPVAAFLPEEECLVTRFVEGRPATSEEVRGEILGAVAGALRAFHSGPSIGASFDSFDVVREYRATTLAKGGTVPKDWEAAWAAAERIHEALSGPEHSPVPCHDDLLPANILRDDERIWLVDWEYAGMGDRYFDLANLAVNNEFSSADDRRLLESYWGEAATPARLAALGLMRVMSDFREAMWGVVQTVLSDLDFDFPDYAERHFARMRESIEQPWFEEALDAASA